MDLTPENHGAFIAATFPSVGQITRMDEIVGGSDSYTYLVNGTLIFQFPLPVAPHGCFAGQMQLLGRLKGKLPSRIPAPEFIRNAPLCMCYRRIYGMCVRQAMQGEWPEQMGGKDFSPDR